MSAKRNLDFGEENVKNKKPNVYSSMSNTIVEQANLLYFVGKWGEKSETVSRARELMETIKWTHLKRIKHNYTKPSMFGFENEEEGSGNVHWVICKDFIESVVRKEAAEACGFNHLYLEIVRYLIEEGKVPTRLFDATYSTDFSQTFEMLYRKMNPEIRGFCERAVEMRKKREEIEVAIRSLVFTDLVNKIEEEGYLEKPAHYFSFEQCESLGDLGNATHRIESSAIGNDLRCYILEKMR